MNWKKMEKEVIVAYFKAVSQHFNASTEEIKESVTKYALQA
jgi:hypothetical protein